MLGLTDVHDPDPDPVDGNVGSMLLAVWVRVRSGEKWIELNAGLRSVGVGVALVLADLAFVEICAGDVVNEAEPLGRMGRFCVLLCCESSA